MAGLLKKIYRERGFRPTKDDVRMLRGSKDCYYLNQCLDRCKSFDNLRAAIAELVYPSEQHCGNGLMISLNGYMLLPEHCLDCDIDVRLRDGKLHSWRFCCSNKHYDLALIKLAIGGPSELLALKYSPVTNQKPKRDRYVSLVGRRDGEIFAKRGRQICNPDMVIQQTEGLLGPEMRLIEGLDSQDGDSGAVISGADAEVYGLHCGRLVPDTDGLPCRRYGYFTPWENAISLVLKYAFHFKLT